MPAVTALAGFYLKQKTYFRIRQKTVTDSLRYLKGCHWNSQLLHILLEQAQPSMEDIQPGIEPPMARHLVKTLTATVQLVRDHTVFLV